MVAVHVSVPEEHPAPLPAEPLYAAHLSVGAPTARLNWAQRRC